MAHDVFLSFANKDRAAGETVRRVLEGGGVRVWMAPRDIIPGSNWAESITAAIREARILVRIFSSSANASETLWRELGYAVSHGKPVIAFGSRACNPRARWRRCSPPRTGWTHFPAAGAACRSFGGIVEANVLAKRVRECAGARRKRWKLFGRGFRVERIFLAAARERSFAGAGGVPRGRSDSMKMMRLRAAADPRLADVESRAETAPRSVAPPRAASGGHGGSPPALIIIGALLGTRRNWLRLSQGNWRAPWLARKELASLGFASLGDAARRGEGAANFASGRQRFRANARRTRRAISGAALFARPRRGAADHSRDGQSERSSGHAARRGDARDWRGARRAPRFHPRRRGRRRHRAAPKPFVARSSARLRLPRRDATKLRGESRAATGARAEGRRARRPIRFSVAIDDAAARAAVEPAGEAAHVIAAPFCPTRRPIARRC